MEARRLRAKSMGEARESVLARIRATTGEDDVTEIAAEWAALPRSYRRSSRLDRQGTLALLAERLRDYDAYVMIVRASELGAAIHERLAANGHPRMLVPPGLPRVLSEASSFTVDAGFSYEELDRFGGVLTTATVAIALTGTLVLQHVPGQGRRAATLIPDYHLCVVAAEDVVETVPEAMARLQPTAALATTFVSGPSATADIEMTRIKGVHGPRVLDVVIVVGDDADPG